MFHRKTVTTWIRQGAIMFPLALSFCFQTFLLKITTNYDDGSLFVLKSVPCEAGSSDEICMVEVQSIKYPIVVMTQN